MLSYSEYLQQYFPGVKVQKLSLDAGFSCPNRDGTIGTGGCSYCRCDSFSPAYCQARRPIREQIEEGKRFFSRKYPQMKYLAYFQSYTNTHLPSLTTDLSPLTSLYREALECDDVVGLVVGTRPDTLPAPVLDLLAEINRDTPVFLEIGAETSSNATLRRINRGHTWADVINAVSRAHKRGLHVGLHLIAGLPGEDNSQILENVKLACSLPIETLKLHQLQILKGTPLAREYEAGAPDIKPFGLDAYLNLCAEICRMVPDTIVIERFLSQSPPDMVIAPKWGMKNYQFHDRLANILRENSNKNKSN